MIASKKAEKNFGYFYPTCTEKQLNIKKGRTWHQSSQLYLTVPMTSATAE